MAENRYGSLASLAYQLDKPVGRSFGDVEFYLAALEGSSGTVLEPAVGNGRVMVPLLEAGVQLEGFDASPEMLALCAQNCAAHGLPAPVSQLRFEEFAGGGPYRAIIIPAGSLQLITDFGTALEVLARFRSSLDKGGRLIVDMGTPGAFFHTAARRRHWPASDDALLTLEETPASRDDLAQTVTWQHRYELWRNGELMRSELEVFTLRWWSSEEFRMALARCGFGEVRVYGDYDRSGALAAEHQTLSFEAFADARE
jgi:hypothetical protein